MLLNEICLCDVIQMYLHPIFMYSLSLKNLFIRALQNIIYMYVCIKWSLLSISGRKLTFYTLLYNQHNDAHSYWLDISSIFTIGELACLLNDYFDTNTNKWMLLYLYMMINTDLQCHNIESINFMWKHNLNYFYPCKFTVFFNWFIIQI